MATPTDTDGLLKMADLAERAGVSPATVKHYLREGLLDPAPGEPGVVRTSRNMAWYPPAFVDRIRLVKRLQEERYMPLRAIRELLGGEGEAHARRLLAREGEILDRVRARPEVRRHLDVEPRDALIARTGVPAPLLDKFAELGVLGPGTEGYAAEEVRIVEAILRFRATGFGEEIGFTAYDVLRYYEALGPLVREETTTFLRRLVDEDLDVDHAVDLMLGAVDPLRELVGAIHGELVRREIARAIDGDRPAGTG
ncbi:MerR family transcriptional regulator [Patulibacter brassicae]|jgi:DNA-binding transcriptional MerR regulator|uniref:MerR family transcriptional regulator n=1 Tax=Patulibacter brassicae TaxID=1705717 RepID=A0ABU4VNP7_9ACTN|nr:MerR family transcriptional regulator [Patulibacter brassicae]MDX8152957.1 MerR family transcriptional regulator [Patulibacter brassicae]